jgi:IS30 family transposase
LGGHNFITKGNKQAIVSVDERKSGYAVLPEVKDKPADLVSNAIIVLLKPLVAAKVRTLTYDNGNEFTDHASIDQALGSKANFANPYSSWQRESNESLNGLIRQYTPKSRPLSTVSNAELAKSKAFLKTDLVKAQDIKHLSRSLRNHSIPLHFVRESG